MTIETTEPTTSLDRTLGELEALGTAQNRKVYARHGVRAPMYGVAYGKLRPLAKRIGTDHQLARALWASGNHDARILATLIADPEAISSRQLDAWARDLDDYIVTDAVAGLAARGPHARRKAEVWSARKGEWVSAAGWGVIASLAGRDGARDVLDDEICEAWIETIARDIHQRPNRVRYAMNTALIAIGIKNAALKAKAKAAAKRIGKVEVDHGETGCKTPDALPYIDKAWAYKQAKAERKRR